MEELQYSLIYNARMIISKLIDDEEKAKLIIEDEFMISISRNRYFTEYILEAYDDEECPELTGKQVIAYHGLEEELSELDVDGLNLIRQYYSRHDGETVRLYKNF